MQLAMTIDELHDFLARDFPQVAGSFEVVSVAPMQITVKLKVNDDHLRPGGTVSGPTMFGLADVSVYLAVLAMIGPKGLSVTTSCAMDFMRKPAAETDLICECRLLKLGKVLAVGDALIFSEGDPKPVARANMTYSIPPKS
ncbi:MAG: PaaI family thioesterase [Dinoroseobacter sp.]|nr:PaaI family thioesterase [Dinoroseobacter sp.]